MTAMATLTLTPSQLMAFRDLVLSYYIDARGPVDFLDVVAGRTTTVEELLQLLIDAEPQRPRERPPNTITSVELDAMLERVHAAQRKAREIQIVGLDSCAGRTVRPVPDTAGLDLEPPCHQGAPVRARYANGVLTLRCALCKSGLANVLVGAL